MLLKNFSICSIDLFGNDIRHFWMGELYGILEKFPSLEFPHKQDFYTLITIESAIGEIIIDNHTIRLDKAKIIIINPRCISNININRQAKGKIICFTEDFFSLRYNNNILSEFSFLQTEVKPYSRLNEGQLERFKILLKLLTDEFTIPKKKNHKVLRSYLNIILFELEKLYTPLGFIRSTNLKQEKIHQFETLIENHFTTKKLPSAYANLLNLSPNYLNKICKEETGKTAGKLIRKRISVEAERLLHYTNYSVNEIAIKLGFENTSYFITFFKKQTKVTPEEFRKIQK